MEIKWIKSILFFKSHYLAMHVLLGTYMIHILMKVVSHISAQGKLYPKTEKHQIQLLIKEDNAFPLLRHTASMGHAMES